jgi:anti-sigma factor RsiW
MTETLCKEFADRIVDYVDGELPQEEVQVVARHLAECERCCQTADALRRSLGLARVLWEDNLGDTTAVRSDAVGAPPRGRPLTKGRHGGLPLHTLNLPRRWVLYPLAVAASVLLAIGVLMIPIVRPPVGSRPSVDQIERQVARVGMAAELLAATRIVAQCEGTESIVKQQYRYILREYADTPAAASIQANNDLKLGGTSND